MELFFSISGFINALISAVFGVFILLKNFKSKVSLAFALFSLSVAIWSIPYIFWPIMESKSAALLSFQLLHIGASFTSITYFHLATIWLGIEKKKSWTIYTGYFLAFFFSASAFSNFFIVDIVQKFNVRYWGEPGFLYHFYLIYFFTYFIYASCLLFKAYKKSTGIKKSQLKIILIGMIIAYIGGSTNYPLWYNINIPPYGNLLVGLYVVLTFYAIVRYRLLDIKLVLRKSTVVLASFVVVFGFAVLVKILAEKLFLIFDFWVDLLVLAVGIFTYPYVRDYFFRLANKYFFSSLYDSRKVILETTNKIRAFLDAKKIYEFLDKTFADIFHAQKFGVLDFDEKDNCYSVIYNNGFNLGNRKKFVENSALHNMFIKKNKTIILEEAKDLHYNEKTKETIDLMDKMGVELLVPLNIKKRTVGLLVLGPKETKEMYNEEDLQVLEIIGGQAAVSIENAQLYGEVKNFNRRLKKEIKEATTDLEKTNKELRTANIRLSNAYKKLRQLDDAKNEFVSIASHQLRTPLTSIKGFISMILQGDFGKYSSSVEDALKKIYISNERLIKLVNDLLSISRIEAGRFVFNLNKNNIKELISKTAETFEMEAKNKNLDLKVDLPEKNPEPFVFDKEKIQEVISNLIDNAIKYTHEGEIEIKLEDLKNKARITVSDSGKGMLKSEIESVFEKFRRGKKSNNLNTEGTGLGLYVCKKIVSAHQGKIWAESGGVGKGSRFIVEIPKNLKAMEREATQEKKKR